MTFSRTLALALGTHFDLGTEAAAPAAPTAAPTAPIVAAPAPAAVSPIEEMRQRFAALTTPETPTPATPSHHSATQPRDPAGQFVEGQAGDPNAPAAPLDSAAPPETVPTDAEGAEASLDAVDDGEAGEIDPLLVVDIPNRYPEQEPLQVTAADPETAERLRQLVNGYQRSEQIREARQQLDADREQLDGARMQLEVDPVGVVLEHAPAPDRVSLARALVTDPVVFAELAPMLTSFLMVSVDEQNRVRYDIDERAYRTAQVEAENERLNRTRVAEQQVVSRRESQRAAARVTHALEQLTEALPPTMSEAQRAIFREDAMGDLVRHLRETRAQALHPADIPHVLARRLAVVGLTPEQATAAILAASPAGAPTRADGAPRRGEPRAPGAAAAGARPAVGASPAPASGAARPAPGTRTIAQIKAGSARRAAVAAQAPGGAGASTGVGTYSPPPGADLKTAIADFRNVVRARRAPA